MAAAVAKIEVACDACGHILIDVGESRVASCIRQLRIWNPSRISSLIPNGAVLMFRGK
jgi:hypothetical protein